jgi:TolB-like protein/Flp pilus assembly protein TadD
LDFGLAKLRLSESSAAISELPTEVMTEEGRVLGTYPYMSPEQVEGKVVDQRSDIFSLGTMLYEMATGCRPFQGDSPASLMSAILRDMPSGVDEERQELPHHLGRIIRQCQEKDPEDRYQSVKDVRNELKSLKKETETGAISASRGLDAKPAPRSGWRSPLITVGAIAMVATIVLLVLWGRTKTTRSTGAGAAEVASEAQHDQVAGTDRKMIVVLPFENLGASEDDYFAAGVTEEITSRLAVVSGLGVISRTSATQYPRQGKTMKEIGRDLGVDYVLEGTVRWAKEGGSSRVRITPQLIQVVQDTHLWADTYDRVIEDIFAVQSEIAEIVIGELGIKLLDRERQSLVVAPTDNFAAYQAYLQGLEVYHRPNAGASLFEVPRRAANLFEKAVTLDPTFARAWAWLSRMKGVEHFWGGTEPDLVAGAKSALDRATELAPEDAYVRIARGYYHYYGLRDFDRALQEFEAISRELPNDVEAIAAIAAILRRQGRFEDSIGAEQRTLVLDPQNVDSLFSLAVTYRAQRRFDDAIASLDRAIALAPDNAALYEQEANYMRQTGRLSVARRVLREAPVTDPMHEAWFWLEFFDRNFEVALEHAEMLPREEPIVRLDADWALSDALFELDRSEEAREVLRQAAGEAETLFDAGSIFAGEFLGWIYARLGRKEEAIRAGQRQVELYSNDLYRRSMAEDSLAYINFFVGNPDAAVEIFDRLLATDYGLAITTETLRLDPRLDALRECPRFQAMLDRHGKNTG